MDLVWCLPSKYNLHTLLTGEKKGYLVYLGVSLKTQVVRSDGCGMDSSPWKPAAPISGFSQDGKPIHTWENLPVKNYF